MFFFKSTKRLKTAGKKQFEQHLGARSTQKLVEIHNSSSIHNPSSELHSFFGLALNIRYDMFSSSFDALAQQGRQLNTFGHWTWQIVQCSLLLNLKFRTEQLRLKYFITGIVASYVGQTTKFKNCDENSLWISPTKLSSHLPLKLSKRCLQIFAVKRPELKSPLPFSAASCFLHCEKNTPSFIPIDRRWVHDRHGHRGIIGARVTKIQTVIGCCSTL